MKLGFWEVLGLGMVAQFRNEIDTDVLKMSPSHVC